MRVFCNEQNIYYIQTEYIICSYNNFIIKDVDFLLYTFAYLSNTCIQTIVACNVNL